MRDLASLAIAFGCVGVCALLIAVFDRLLDRP